MKQVFRSVKTLVWYDSVKPTLSYLFPWLGNLAIVLADIKAILFGLMSVVLIVVFLTVAFVLSYTVAQEFEFIVEKLIVIFFGLGLGIGVCWFAFTDALDHDLYPKMDQAEFDRQQFIKSGQGES